jgi:hypothetical protein
VSINPEGAGPPAPTGVTAVPGWTGNVRRAGGGQVGSTTNGQATVSWDAVAANPSITSYMVIPYGGGATPSPQPPVVLTGSPPGTSIVITGLTNGASYYFTVTATNTVGTSPESTPSSTIVPAPPAQGTCEQCKFYDPASADVAGAGYCRVNSPSVPGWPPRAAGAASWPLVQATDWCGQFQSQS